MQFVSNIEQNYKDFYSIMYNYWRTDSITNNEKTIIENIAWQCPIIGGTVVYSARNFFDYINNFNTEFEDFCDTESRIFSDAPIYEKSFDEIFIYPNPNNGEFTFKLKNTNMSGKLLIFDVTGKIIYSVNTFNPPTKIRLPDIVPGVYIIEFTNDDKVVRAKFILE